MYPLRYSALLLPIAFLVQTSAVPAVPYSFPAEIKRSWTDGSGTRFEALCLFSVAKTFKPSTKNIIIDFSKTVKRFESWVGDKISPTGRTGTLFHLKNKHWMHPEKQEFVFQATYFGSTPPTVVCSSNLPHYPPYDTTTPAVTTTTSPTTTTTTTEATTAPLSFPTLPYSFPATIERRWIDNDLLRIEALCVLEVTESTEPEQKNIIVEFGENVERFEHWVGLQLQPTRDSGIKFHMTNLHWLHAPKQDFYFQASFTDTNDPSVPMCSSDLPPILPPTTSAPTTTKAMFTFPATVLRNWTDNGDFRIEALCMFEVVQSTVPYEEEFIIDFQMPVERFEHWVGKAISPEGDSGEIFQLTNLHWLHAPKQDFFFQANYVGTTNPPVPMCSSTLPEYIPPTTTAAPTSSTASTTTSSTTTDSSTATATSSTTGSTTTEGTSPTTASTTTGSTLSTASTTIGSTPSTASTTTGSTPSTASTTTGSTPSTASTTAGSTTTTDSTTPSIPAQYNYTEVIEKSIWFYRAQRSGDLPADPNDPVPWRGDSALYDGNDVGEDLTGGWYDAGDWVKFNFPISSATAILAWGLVQWEDAYAAVGLQDEMLDCIKWSLDFFLKCWKPNEQILYGQVGDGDIDHSKMMRPEDMTPSNMQRPTYTVTSSVGGSDLAGSMVAAFAAGSIAFKTADPTYSAHLLDNAKSLYTFADSFRGSYTTQISDAGAFYPSSAYTDELVYAAAMLHKATGDINYLNDAESKYQQFGFGSQSSWAFDWSDKLMAARVLLFEATGDSIYSSEIQKFVNKWVPGGSIQNTPGGLAWRAQWGSLRYSANAAFIALMAADLGLSPASNIQWAESQIHYMLGDNPRQSSYVVGFGNNPPKNPHHKSSTCAPAPAACDWNVYNSNADNAHVLYGALVGGPDANDNYNDDRTDYIMAEVTCDYNAGFHSSVAALLSNWLSGR